MSIDSRPSVDRVSIDSRSSVDRVSTATSTDIAVDIAVDSTYSKHDPSKVRGLVTHKALRSLHKDNGDSNEDVTPKHKFTFYVALRNCFKSIGIDNENLMSKCLTGIYAKSLAQCYNYSGAPCAEYHSWGGSRNFLRRGCITKK